MNIINHTLTFWTGLIGAIFIVLHLPTCNAHWADKLPLISKTLRKYHNPTLYIATISGIIHIILAIIELIGGKII